MKKIVLPFLALLPWCAGAQNLAAKIPQDATIVVSVKGNALQELMSVDEFNRSSVGIKFLQNISENMRDVRFNSIEDFGVNLKSTGYYFLQQTDSVRYHCMLLPLADSRKFENLFTAKERGQIETKGGLHTLSKGGGQTLVQWDNEMALFVTGDLNDRFLEQDPEMQERYGIEEVNYGDYYYDRPDEAAASAYEVEAMADTPYYAEEVVEEDLPAVPDTAYATITEAEEDIPVVDIADIPPPPPPPRGFDEDDETVVEIAAPAGEYEETRYYNNDAYEKAYNEQTEKKDKLGAEWTGAFAAKIIARSEKDKNILANSNYLAAQDPEAVATFYLSDFSGVLSQVVPYSYRYLGGSFQGYGSLDAQLFMNEKEIRVKSNMHLDDEKSDQLSRMYKHKLNKKFAKYINDDKMLGFFSYSLDTKAYLDVMPQMMEQVYGSVIGGYKEEIGLTAELFSLLLDEEAIAKVIKGDALFVLTDIGPKEYSYTTYSYDDDYERKEITKTKTETLPDFLVMVSSDDTRLLEKVLKYGIRKEVVAQKNGVYSLVKKTRNLPFDLHLLVKDGIVFLGTSYRDIQQINDGTFEGSITKAQKKLMLKNNAAMYFNPRKMLGKIPEGELGRKSTAQLNNFLAKTDVVYARSSGVKNNRSGGEFIAQVPEGQVNGLKYFFSLIDVFAQ